MPNSELTPIHVTAKDAAAIVGGGTSPWTIHRLCRLGAIESRMRDGRRLVVLSSLHEYIESLPAGHQQQDEESA